MQRSLGRSRSLSYYTVAFQNSFTCSSHDHSYGPEIVVVSVTDRTIFWLVTVSRNRTVRRTAARNKLRFGLVLKVYRVCGHKYIPPLKIASHRFELQGSCGTCTVSMILFLWPSHWKLHWSFFLSFYAFGTSFPWCLYWKFLWPRVA